MAPLVAITDDRPRLDPPGDSLTRLIVPGKPPVLNIRRSFKAGAWNRSDPRNPLWRSGAFSGSSSRIARAFFACLQWIV
jgi:hypothetical protein